MGEAIRLISTSYGLPVVCTPEAAKVTVSCYFTDIGLETALQALCRAHDLWVTVSPEGVLIISTLQEHLDSESYYTKDYVETVTVKYPTVYDVGDTLKGLFRDRIVWERPDEDAYDPMDRLEQAMDRMDLLSERSQFSVSDSGSSSSSSSSRSSGSGSSSSRSSRSSSRSSSNDTGYDSGEDTDQMQALAENRQFLNNMARERIERGIEDEPPLALVYLSALPEINTLLIRSSDHDAVQSVRKAIEDMDKPRGQVLLKVTVLAVQLNDDLQTGVEWLIEKGNFNSGFADGAIGTIATNLANYTTGVPVFAFVSGDMQFEAKLLAETKNVRQLANPTLLVADNEAANVFIGKNAKFLDQIEPAQVVVNQSTTTTQEATPVLQDRNVGLSLLITPRVHANRTVTLRILQERSEADPTYRDINYGTDQNIQVQDIDQAVVVSTLVAKDRSLVVLGGLVQEHTTQTDSGVPLLRDIPLLGMLFSQKEEEVVNEELIVLIQPYVLAIPGEEHEASATVLEELGVDMTTPIEHLKKENEEQPVGRLLESQMPLQR
ncbi:MAG: type II secretion system protein GspD [Puniceicoccales bacterium]